MPVTELKTKASASNQEVIDLLEDVLLMAKNGEILSIGLCAVLTEGRIGEFTAGYRNTASLLGASMLMQDMIKDKFGD